MFEFIRSNTRLLMGFLLLLIIPSFIFFGIEGYSGMTDGGNATVARVDGRNITKSEWDQAHQRNVERMRRQMPNVDAKLLDTAQMRRESLDGLVRERVLLAAANAQHLLPSDERLQRLFLTDPQFAGLRNPDGTVNRDILAAQGMSSELFAAQLRQEFGMQQVLGVIGTSSLTPDSVAAVSLDALLQQREVQVQRFDPVALRSRVAPTDADLENDFKANASRYSLPERAAIEYVVLDLDTLMKGFVLPADELQRYYGENIARYTSAEERRASHILIAAEKERPAAQRGEARARAEALLGELRTAPGRFAELARANSQDPGSAANGGDLDFFGRGAMTKPFEDAVFAMQQGEISKVIETDFGFHIIQLNATRGGQPKAFEAVRPEIEAEVRKSLAQRRWAEAAEQFTNMAYEQSDSLQPLVDKWKLDKRSADAQRTPAPGATGALASAKLLAAVFGNEAVQNKRNTEAVEIGPNQLASARVVQHTPARTPTLTEVKDRVRESVVASQAAALARAQGQALVQALQKAPSADAPGAAPRPALDPALTMLLTVSRAQPQGLPPALLDAALRADATALPTVVGVDLGDQGFAAVRVLKVLPRATTASDDAALKTQVSRAWADAEAQATLGLLKRQFGAEVKDKVVADFAAADAKAAAP